MAESVTEILTHIAGGQTDQRIARETHHCRYLIREIRHGLSSLDDRFALTHPLGTSRKVTRELIAEADRLTRREPRLGSRYVMCILPEPADFPSVVNLLMAFMQWRIQKLCENGGIALITESKN
jgi:hypothetical protein